MDHDDDGVLLMVWSWSAHQPVFLEWQSIPDDWRDHLRLHENAICQCNIGAERLEDLRFSDWEIAPLPDPEDGLA
jgi:hypothetical protein